jgi:flagellar basal body P-ring formation protein FlgA
VISVPASSRHLLLFVATIAAGLIATLLAPLLPSRSLAAQTVWTRAVATLPLARDDTLRAHDFIFADTTLAQSLPYGLDTTSPAEGWLVQRAVQAGEWLRRPTVIPAPAVTAGRPVHALWHDGTVRVAVAGVALNSAPVGGRVAIRVGRARRLDGVVVAPDSVRLR